MGRRTTSATWSSLTSSSPPPPKSLSTRLHNIAEFQEFPGNRKKRPMELQRRLTRRKKKSALNSIWGRRCEPLEPGHIANAKHRNEIFRVIMVSDPFVRRSKFSHHLR